MTLKTKFNIDQKVYISELKIWGRVLSIYYNSRTKYDIRYFNGYDAKEAYFLEEELNAEADKKEVGYKIDK